MSNTRRKFNSETSYRKRVIMVESDPEVRKTLSRLLFTRLFVQVSLADSFGEALDIIMNTNDDISYVIFDENAARALSERALADYLQSHQEITTKFILFAKQNCPQWPGKLVRTIDKAEITTLLTTVAGDA